MALVSALLALASVAHYLARFTQIGGMQMAPSIAFYCMIPLLLRNLSWRETIMIGLINGILLSIATSSPFPLANIPSHWIGLVIPKLFVEAFKRSVGVKLVAASIATSIIVNGPIFILAAYYGMMNIPQLAVSSTAVERFRARFTTLTAFFTYGMTFVVIPTLILDAFILGPALYAALKPALARYGFIEVG